MTEKRRGLGRGLGALIPAAPDPSKPQGDRPVDVFFPDRGDPAPEDGTSAGEQNGAAAANGKASTANGQGMTTDGATTAPQSGSADDTVHANGAGSSVKVRDAAAGPELVPVPGARFAEVPLSSITPNPKQPRQVFEEESLAELVHSIREIGVLQPIVVRPGTPVDDEARYELIMGERRWRAAQDAGLTAIPAIIRDTSDDDLLRDALLENLHRSQLNALEEAAAYQQLLDDFGCTHEELATRIGRSRPQISNTIRLLRLPPPVQRRVAAGVLSAGHARALLGLDGHEAMDALAQRIVSEGMSVRATEEAVALSDGSTTESSTKRRPRAGGRNIELDDLAGRLADRLDTRVTIALGRSKGRLSVEFASVEDLNRILGLLAPDERGAFKPV